MATYRLCDAVDERRERAHSCLPFLFAALLIYPVRWNRAPLPSPSYPRPTSKTVASLSFHCRLTVASEARDCRVGVTRVSRGRRFAGACRVEFAGIDAIYPCDTVNFGLSRRGAAVQPAGLGFSIGSMPSVLGMVPIIVRSLA